MTLNKTVNGHKLTWKTTQEKFGDQYMSKTKQAEVTAELDTLHISTIRAQSDTDRRAIFKLIGRLDKLSLLRNADDLKNEPKIRRLHNAIVDEQWTYYALCQIPVV